VLHVRQEEFRAVLFQKKRQKKKREITIFASFRFHIFAMPR